MVCLVGAPWCCSSIPLLLCASPLRSWVCDSGLEVVWGFRQSGKMYFLAKGLKAEGFFSEKEKQSKLALPPYGSSALHAPWWNAAGDLCGYPLWLAVSCVPFLSLGGISPLPLQMDACVSGWPFPSWHSWRDWTRGRGQELAAAGGFQMCVGAAPLGSTAGSLCWLLEGTTQAGLPAGTGTAGMSFDTVFKALMSFLDAKFVSSLSLSAFTGLFHFSSFAPRGLQWMLLLVRRTKREKVVLCTCPGWLVTSHLPVLIQSKISAKFPSAKCFAESALWLGNISLLQLLVCWNVRNMLEKPQGKDELNLCCCFFLNYEHCKIKMNTKSVTNFQNCAVKIFITFLKSLKAFPVQNIFF